MTGKQVLWLGFWLVLGMFNAFMSQFLIDLGAGRVPVPAAVQPYVPSAVAALAFMTAFLGALLPNVRGPGAAGAAGGEGQRP